MFAIARRAGFALAPPFVAVALVGSSTPASAAPTRAGTIIDNQATATFQQGGQPVTLRSNTVSVRVDELIDPTVSWEDGTPVQTAPGGTRLLRYSLANSGNGSETFRLSTDAALTGDQFDPTVNRIFIDANKNGTYEPGTDILYVAGSNDPTLEPGEIVSILVETSTAATTTNGQRGDVSLLAASTTGTGAPGTSFAGKAEGGGTAVLGSSGGDDSAIGALQVAAATVALTKAAVVSNRFNTTEAIPGATITYTIVATTSGSGSIAGLEINDSIPAGTTYVDNSLTLGAAPLTDASDTDAGRFANQAITVALGTVPAGETRTISFKVTVNAN